MSKNPHTLGQNVEEIGADVVFTCLTCGAKIGFNKPGIGEPAAIEGEPGQYTPPANFMDWMDPCS